GDLNYANIICDEIDNIWFIDWTHSNYAPLELDFAKLESLNAHYIQTADNAYLWEQTKPFFQSRHGITPSDQAQQWIIAHMDELKSRNKTLIQLSDDAVFYCKTAPLDYDEKAGQLLDQDGSKILQTLLAQFETLGDWNETAIQDTCKALAQNNHDGKLGKVAMPLRAALTGTTKSPSVFKAAEILGRSETSARMQAAIDFSS
ncbi:MAG: hypothetical protein ACPGRX_07615, partial [Bdellovibrionales bacterium]